jgi:YD repeat-containing protein
VLFQPTPINVSFSYDAVGNHTAMSNGSELQQYAYDGMSRLTHEDINFPGLDYNWRRISYGYNLAGQVTRVTNPWGSEVAYGHDSEGRVTQVTGSGSGSAPVYAQGLKYLSFLPDHHRRPTTQCAPRLRQDVRARIF